MKYMLSHDIDWFCKVNDKWISCATLGGMLPDFVDNDKMLPYFQTLCYEIPESKEDYIECNERLLQERYQRHCEKYAHLRQNALEYNQEIDEVISFDTFKQNYISSFVDMAKRGFYAYARVNIDDVSDDKYYLIAKPTKDSSVALSKVIDGFAPSLISIEEFKDFVKQLSIKRRCDFSFGAPLIFHDV